MTFQVIILAVAVAIPLVAGLVLVADAVRRLFHRKRKTHHVLHV